jgi:hypothetical protein
MCNGNCVLLEKQRDIRSVAGADLIFAAAFRMTCARGYTVPHPIDYWLDARSDGALRFRLIGEEALALL